MGSRACALLRPPDDYGSSKWWTFPFFFNVLPQLLLSGGSCQAGPSEISGTFTLRVLTRFCPFSVIPALLLSLLGGIVWTAIKSSGLIIRLLSQSMVACYLTSTAWAQVNGMLVAHLSLDLPRFLIWLLAEECQWWLPQLWFLLHCGATAVNSLIFCGTLFPLIAQVLELVGGRHPVMQWIWLQHIMVYLVQRLSVSSLLWHGYPLIAQVEKLVGGRHPIMW